MERRRRKRGKRELDIWKNIEMYVEYTKRENRRIKDVYMDKERKEK